MPNSTLPLDREIHLLDLLGERLEAHAEEVELDLETGHCTLHLEVSPDAWTRIRRDGLFHLDAAVVFGELDDFEPERPVRLELEPIPIARRVLFEQEEPDIALGAALLGEGPLAELLGRADAWRTRTAVQRLDPPPELADAVIEVGVATVWGQDEIEPPGDGFVGFNDNFVEEDDDGEFGLDEGGDFDEDGDLDQGGDSDEDGDLDEDDEDDEPIDWIEDLEDLLERHDLGWSAPQPGIYRIDFEIESGVWTTLVHTDPEDGICAVTSIWPEQVAEDDRARVALELSRRNYELAVGSYEVDPQDGEVRYRTGIDLGQADPDPLLLEALVLGSLHMVAETYDEIADLIG